MAAVCATVGTDTSVLQKLARDQEVTPKAVVSSCVARLKPTVRRAGKGGGSVGQSKGVKVGRPLRLKNDRLGSYARCISPEINVEWGVWGASSISGVLNSSTEVKRGYSVEIWSRSAKCALVANTPRVTLSIGLQATQPRLRGAHKPLQETGPRLRLSFTGVISRLPRGVELGGASTRWLEQDMRALEPLLVFRLPYFVH
ncbi:hypothetical protein B0H17DRAFT_1130560 [Mycena rosella]|uniref:Uncharacterized protein n=1 Tax=Mycena rosella TaxID=1033263 RepID=A0AAD7GJ75_MYCRO|nr:hypothetical protein B0H17DRAFT_1130560 [Mycena rosella]